MHRFKLLIIKQSSNHLFKFFLTGTDLAPSLEISYIFMLTRSVHPAVNGTESRLFARNISQMRIVYGAHSSEAVTHLDAVKILILVTVGDNPLALVQIDT